MHLYLFLITTCFVMYFGVVLVKWVGNIYCRCLLLIIIYISLQFFCGQCLQGFHNKRRLRSHEAMCVFCINCSRYMDRRHLKNCKGKKFKTERVLCNKCNRIFSKSNMRRHMKSVHKTEDWTAADHPEVIPEVCCLLYTVGNGLFE